MSAKPSEYKDFIKNPIGFFGLLMFLFEAVMGLVFSIGLNNLHGDKERLPFLWFLIAFPILVLFIFTYLVIFKPRNLYGPGDYHDDESFLAATSNEIKKNIEKELKAIDTEVKKASPETKDNAKKKTLSSADLYEAESIGIGAAEKHLGIQLETNIKFRRSGGGSIFLDGYAKKDDKAYVVEVKVAYPETWLPQTYRGISQLRTAAAFLSDSAEEIVPVLVIVLLAKSPETEEKIKNFVKSRAPHTTCIIVPFVKE